MVSVSMVWPGLLAALLIVYCINMRKKKKKKTIPVTSTMITGFFRLLPSGGGPSVLPPIFLVMFLFHFFFSWYIFYHVHTFTPFSPVDCTDSHLLDYFLRQDSAVQKVIIGKQPCKMFIKTLKSISSYVPHRRPTVSTSFGFSSPLGKHGGNHNHTVPPSGFTLSFGFLSFIQTWNCLLCTSSQCRPDQFPLA